MSHFVKKLGTLLVEQIRGQPGQLWTLGELWIHANQLLGGVPRLADQVFVAEQ